MNLTIPDSGGVFPPSGDIPTMDNMESPEIEVQQHTTNYKSFTDNPDDAEIEVRRYVEAGFAILLKPEGGVKRRVVVDLLRSGGNSRTTTPERIVLPRIQDVTQMAREVTEHMGTQRESAPEFVLFDLQDAFCHWPVAKEELGNCLAPSANANKAILFRALFRALLFGYKSAPLLMGRLSAAIGRMWQAMMEKGEGRLQIYIDDALMIITGSEAERADKISMGLYTLRAFGVNIALRSRQTGPVDRCSYPIGMTKSRRR